MKTLLLSLLAYLCLFAFEGGYCSWFGIPLELVKLDATRFLVFAGSVASFFVVVAPVLFAWFDNLLNDATEPANTRTQKVCTLKQTGSLWRSRLYWEPPFF